MSDYSELERRAQAAIDAIGTLSRARQEREFNDVCTPQVVLAQLAENKRLERLALNSVNAEYAVSTDLESICVERDKLRAEVTGLKTGYEAYERVNAELKAECEALRKLTVELRGSAECHNVHHCKAEEHELGDPCKVLARIDAAMGKGDRP